MGSLKLNQRFTVSKEGLPLKVSLNRKFVQKRRARRREKNLYLHTSFSRQIVAETKAKVSPQARRGEG